MYEIEVVRVDLENHRYQSLNMHMYIYTYTSRLRCNFNNEGVQQNQSCHLRSYETWLLYMVYICV